MPNRSLVVAIDGPGGAGKSTVAKMLAKELGIRYLDTGAMYRALGLKAMRAGLSRDDGPAAAKIMESTEITVRDGEPLRVLLDGEEVNDSIRSLEIGDWASSLSTDKVVRSLMVSQQQAIIAAGGFVLEGRDTTTVIAPNADLKVFMTASLEERARRRMLELQARGEVVDFQTVRNQIEERDHRDITRHNSPLKVADDARIVETAGRTPEEVVEIIRSLAVQA